MDRRDFLKKSAKGAALAAASSSLGFSFAQAWYGKSPNLLGEAKGNRVVIIGGGWGGTTVARQLLRSGGAEVVMIEQNPFFISCPMSNLYLAGVKPLDFITFEYSEAISEGMIFINERALEIDRDSKVVATSAGNVSYDYLVLSPGIDYMNESIEGFDEVAHLMPVGFKPFEHIALRRKIENFEGGDFIISIPKPPYRCPPGPYERVAMLAWYLKENLIPGKITVLDANNNPLAKANGFLAAYDELYGDYVEYIPNADVIGVDYAAKTVKTADLGDFSFDLANIIPQMKAGGIVQQAGLGERWANIALPYFTAEGDDSVYLLGDIVGNLPVPKSGMIANSEGHIVAKQLADRIAGKTKEESAIEMPSNICYSFVNEDEGIWVSADYGWNVGESKVDRTASGLDEARTAANGILAIEWARGLWGDMFGKS
ncbi:MAG: FAD/NAD(P)-binding oxidoreductase [Deinococcales bacterium]